jgi:ubiquinone/menaquinone biosynthesis C-methylase UbiE
MLARVLEPEVMDSPDEAQAYDTMDHAAVNRIFVRDFLATSPDVSRVADLGTGTAQIPLALHSERPTAYVCAVDAAWSMLVLAGENYRRAACGCAWLPVLADSKRLPLATNACTAVMSNSLLHHLPHPQEALSEAVRVCQPGGTLFFRDLLRPGDIATLNNLVQTYAAEANAVQRQLFADSLHAALSLEEVRQMVAELGFPATGVSATSDRHWTWIANK